MLDIENPYKSGTAQDTNNSNIFENIRTEQRIGLEGLGIDVA